MPSDSESSSCDGDEEEATKKCKYVESKSMSRSGGARQQKRKRNRPKSTTGKSFMYEGRIRQKREKEGTHQKKKGEERMINFGEHNPSTNSYAGQHLPPTNMELPNIIQETMDETFGTYYIL